MGASSCLYKNPGGQLRGKAREEECWKVLRAKQIQREQADRIYGKSVMGFS